MAFWPSPAWDAVTYWSLDLETGGLDPRRDAVLAVGMVPVRDGVIRLGEAWSSLVRPAEEVSVSHASIRAHQIVPRDVGGAPALADVLPEVDRRVREGVVLVHNARIDVGFLRRAYARCDRSWPRPRVVDTVDLLVKLLKKQRFVDPEAGERPPTLNLAAARREHGLPDYGLHDALTDAIATAELFLALRRRLGARTLRDVS